MMGSWGWFLINPIFALFSLVDVTKYMQMYTFVSTFSFCVCGTTMYIMLKDFYGHKIDNLIFSTAYALNGFLVANVFQLNFFSVIPILPIMVMGLRRILQNGNPSIYTISIAYALIANFYFGYMICVASLLFFGVSFIENRNRIENRKTVAVKYVVASFLGGMLSSFVWLPAILSLRGGRLDQDISSYITIKENMPFLSMFAKLFTGANTTSELRDGLPNIFVGILTIYLVILFFMSNRISKRKKSASAVLLIVYLISFYACILNLIMHGGTNTNWFNYRDSFVFCFLMIMISAEEWQHIEDEAPEDLKKAAVVLIIATIIVFSRTYEFVTGGAVIIDFTVLIMMIIAYRMYKNDPVRNPRRVFSIVVLILMCFNLFLNYSLSTKNILEWKTSVSEYLQTVIPVSAMIDAVHSSDSSFYRMEIGEQRSGNCGNDPMLYGYYGVGHGGSDDRNFVRTALSELGVHRYDMRNNYGRGVSSATDSLLGLRYIVSKDDLHKEKNYEQLLVLDDWGLYKNKNALPVSLVTNAEVSDVELDIEDVFSNLNSVWAAMAGKKEKIYIEESDVSFSSHNIIDPQILTGKEAASIVSSRDASQSGSIAASYSGKNNESNHEENSNSIKNAISFDKQGTFDVKPEKCNYIAFTWTASRDGAYYSYNRSGMLENKGAEPPALNYEGYHKKGDVVTGYLPVTGSYVTEYLLEEVAGRFKIASVDEDALAEMSQQILSRPSTIEKVTDSHLKGTFTAEAGQELMFTIPYDEGWTLTVDGKKTELKKVLDVFMVADVEPGKHTYEMTFIPSGLKTGVLAAGAALVLIVLYIFLDRHRKIWNIAVKQEEIADNLPDMENIGKHAAKEMGQTEE